MSSSETSQPVYNINEPSQWRCSSRIWQISKPKVNRTLLKLCATAGFLVSCSDGAQPKYRTFLFEQGGKPFQTDMVEVLLSKHPQTGFSWRATKSWRPDLERLELLFEGVAVFRAQSIVEGGRQEPKWVLGNLPVQLQLSGTERRPATTGFKLSFAEARAKHPGLGSLKLVEPVFLPSQSALQAAYLAENIATTNAPAGHYVRYIFSATTGEILFSEPAEFSIEGRTEVYRENSVVSADEGVVSAALPALLYKRTLLGRNLRVVNCEKKEASEANCKPTLKGSGATFLAEPSSPKYDEANGYYALSSMMNWHRSLMSTELRQTYDDFGLKYPMDVFVRGARATRSGSSSLDNAAYLPKGLDNESYPVMIVGTGWEEGDEPNTNRLKNLGKDSDVFRHEFNHHIVFRSISQTSGQALALHEGFADFFADAISGNNVIGESIVQNGEAGLRVAENDNSISSAFMAEEGHVQGEYFSAVLWKLRETLGPWKDGLYVFDKIASNAIDYLPAGACFYQAIAALLRATTDAAEELGIDATDTRAQIIAEFETRGFFASHETLPAGTIPPPASFLGFSGDSVDATLVTDSKRFDEYEGPRRDQISDILDPRHVTITGHPLCGSIGTSHGGTPLSALLALAPMLLLFVTSRIRRRGD